jgi:hypothetical protein
MMLTTKGVCGKMSHESGAQTVRWTDAGSVEVLLGG